MYAILSNIPRFNKSISEEELEQKCSIPRSILQERLGEAQWPSHDYANQCADKRHCWFLTENGQAAIEEYDRAIRANRIVILSFAISIIAAIAGVGSAVATIATFL